MHADAEGRSSESSALTSEDVEVSGSCGSSALATFISLNLPRTFDEAHRATKASDVVVSGACDPSTGGTARLLKLPRAPVVLLAMREGESAV